MGGIEIIVRTWSHRLAGSYRNPLPDGLLTGFNLEPESVIDNPQMWHFDSFPLVGWIRSGDLFPGPRILDVGAVVPFQDATIHRIVQQPGAPPSSHTNPNSA
jgi:hypothetical protein